MMKTIITVETHLFVCATLYLGKISKVVFKFINPYNFRILKILPDVLPFKWNCSRIFFYHSTRLN